MILQTLASLVSSLLFTLPFISGFCQIFAQRERPFGCIADSATSFYLAKLLHTIGVPCVEWDSEEHAQSFLHVLVKEKRRQTKYCPMKWSSCVTKSSADVKVPRKNANFALKGSESCC